MELKANYSTLNNRVNNRKIKQNSYINNNNIFDS
jgi:hypothetical protein